MIKKNINWESLIWIIIAVSILWFVIMWIVNIISYSDDVSSDYETKSNINLIKDNSLTIVKKLNLSQINEWESFYLYKDTLNKEFTIFTWSSNEQYKYIDKTWENINISTFSWEIYERVIILEKKDLANFDNVINVNVTQKKY